MTLICVPIMVQNAASALRDAELARDLSADLVEFRIDEFFTGATGEAGEREIRDVLKLVNESALPCIVTCRPAAGGEGGQYDGEDAARVSLFERLGTAAGANEHPPRYLDVELATYVRSQNIKQKINLAVQHPAQVRDLHTSLILSSHDFNARPADLLRRLAAMRGEEAAAVLKIAYRARSLRDNLELFDLLSERDRPMIALGMGEFGLMSRVLAPKFGGLLTFASLRASSTTAPGQPTVDELLNLFRFRSIDARTRVFGVVGYPVNHSLSPSVHNAGFEEIGKWAERDDRGQAIPGTEAGGVYIPLPIPPEYEHFKATIGAMLDHPRLDFAGCAVTIPHKEHLLRFALEAVNGGDGVQTDSDGRVWEIEDAARACGAANTLAVRRRIATRRVAGTGNPHSESGATQESGTAQCIVLNTDGAAACAALEAVMGSVVGKQVGIIGAGGAARAIAYSLVMLGARVVIFNRSVDRAERLANDLGRGIEARSLDAIGSDVLDAYVNCTPMGMKGGAVEKESAIPADVLGRLAGAVIMDTVYNPPETPLLRNARTAGLRTVDGLAMFVRQAAAQFKAWTGSEAPAGLFERVARETLAAR